LELIISILVVYLGVILKNDSSTLTDYARFAMVFLATGYVIILVIQIFNWFPKKRFGTMLGLYELSLGVGYWFKFLILNQVKDYPSQYKLDHRN